MSEILKTLDKRFTSKNSVPVSQAKITKEEYEKLKSSLYKAVTILQNADIALGEFDGHDFGEPMPERKSIQDFFDDHPELRQLL